MYVRLRMSWGNREDTQFRSWPRSNIIKNKEVSSNFWLNRYRYSQFSRSIINFQIRHFGYVTFNNFNNHQGITNIIFNIPLWVFNKSRRNALASSLMIVSLQRFWKAFIGNAKYLVSIALHIGRATATAWVAVATPRNISVTIRDLCTPHFVQQLISYKSGS